MTPKIFSAFFHDVTFPKFGRHPDAAEAEGQKLTNETPDLGKLQTRELSIHFLDMEWEDLRRPRSRGFLVNSRCLQENGWFLLMGKQMPKALKGNVWKCALWVNLVLKAVCEEIMKSTCLKDSDDCYSWCQRPDKDRYDTPSSHVHEWQTKKGSSFPPHTSQTQWLDVKYRLKKKLKKNTNSFSISHWTFFKIDQCFSKNSKRKTISSLWEKKTKKTKSSHRLVFMCVGRGKRKSLCSELSLHGASEALMFHQIPRPCLLLSHQLTLP